MIGCWRWNIPDEDISEVTVDSQDTQTRIQDAETAPELRRMILKWKGKNKDPSNMKVKHFRENFKKL